MKEKDKKNTFQMISREPYEMSVVAAGNHGFGFGLPFLVTELLGSLFTVWPNAKSLSAVQVQSPHTELSHCKFK